MNAGRDLSVVLAGASGRLLGPDELDMPLTPEGLRAAGANLGAASFVVFDDRTDAVAVAAGVSRFLATGSCGVCRWCRSDGSALADTLDRFAAGHAGLDDIEELADRAATVGRGRRCAVATRQHRLVEGLLQQFATGLHDRVGRMGALAAPVRIAAIDDLQPGQRAVLEWRRSRTDVGPDAAAGRGAWTVSRQKPFFRDTDLAAHPTEGATQ